LVKVLLKWTVLYHRYGRLYHPIRNDLYFLFKYLKMISIRELEDHFRYLPPALMEIMFEIHSLVGHIAPGATTEIRRGGISYYDAGRGGPVSAGICQVLVKPDHIRLAFIHGAFLPDPRGLLEGGDRLAKRFVRIYSFEEASWEALEELIRLHSRFDPYTQTFMLQEE
jgi:hypothetical protein